MKKENNREVDPLDEFMFLMLAGVFPMLVLLESRNYPNSIWAAVWLMIAAVWLMIAMLVMLVAGGIAWHFMIKDVIIPTIKKLLELVKPHE